MYVGNPDPLPPFPLTVTSQCQEYFYIVNATNNKQNFKLTLGLSAPCYSWAKAVLARGCLGLWANLSGGGGRGRGVRGEAIHITHTVSFTQGKG